MNTYMYATLEATLVYRNHFRPIQIVYEVEFIYIYTVPIQHHGERLCIQAMFRIRSMESANTCYFRTAVIKHGNAEINQHYLKCDWSA